MKRAARARLELPGLLRIADSGHTMLLAAALQSVALAGFAAAPARAAPGIAAGTARVEAHSPELLAVAIVSGDRMVIHLSRALDNAPVHDALVTVVVRGAAHSTVADLDGGYSLEDKNLSLPGATAIEFLVTQGTSRADLKGTLEIAAAAAASDTKGSARQLGWWVLNFAVCIGFLWLISRRKKAAEGSE